tara:strand:- start:143 stop:478 length:336 start_codon:yes stop_codon:yes gene_type:complete
MVKEIACEKPIENELTKKELWIETIDVWDYLVESGYRPSDFFGGEVKMNYHGFKKLVEENGKSASIKETRHYRISALWIGHVEISFTEVKTDKDAWFLENKWLPLPQFGVQ